MTLEEFNKGYEDIRASLEQQLEDAKGNTSRRLEDYPGILLKSVTVDISILNLEIEDCISDLTLGLEEYTQHKALKIEVSEIVQSYYVPSYDGAEVEELTYTYSYYKVLPAISDALVREQFIVWVKDELYKGIEGVYPRRPECSMLELFKSGSIDWETLQKITYKDCEL